METSPNVKCDNTSLPQTETEFYKHLTRTDRYKRWDEFNHQQRGAITNRLNYVRGLLDSLKNDLEFEKARTRSLYETVQKPFQRQYCPAPFLQANPGYQFMPQSRSAYEPYYYNTYRQLEVVPIQSYYNPRETNMYRQRLYSIDEMCHQELSRVEENIRSIQRFKNRFIAESILHENSKKKKTKHHRKHHKHRDTKDERYVENSRHKSRLIPGNNDCSEAVHEQQCILDFRKVLKKLNEISTDSEVESSTFWNTDSSRRSDLDE